jgi:hypothetical protein
VISDVPNLLGAEDLDALEYSAVSLLDTFSGNIQSNLT